MSLKVGFQDDGGNACLVVALWAMYSSAASRQSETLQRHRLGFSIIKFFKSGRDPGVGMTQSVKYTSRACLGFIPRHVVKDWV